MRKFSLQIVTPDGNAFDGEVESLLVHTSEGDVEFLAGHVDYIAAIGTGRARLIIDGEAKYASCSGGFLTVSAGHVKLVCVTFEFSESIDLERAKSAKEQAEEKIKNAKDDVALNMSKAKLARAISRIKVAELK